MTNEIDVTRREWVARLSAIGGAVSFAALVKADSAQAWSGGAGVSGTRLLWVDTIKGQGKNLYSTMGSDVDLNSTPAVILGGYAVPNDGGGGVFYWDATSSADNNGGTIVVPRGSTRGRWIWQYSGAINANWFGASAPGADLGAVLNACDAALGASPGQIVISLVNGIGTEANPATLRTHAVIGAKVALQSCKDGLNADQVAQCKAGRRVTLGPGVYAATTTRVSGETAWHGAPWIIGDNSILEGSGPGTILQELKAAPDGDAVSVIVAYGSTDNFAADFGNIIIRDLQVVGVPTNRSGCPGRRDLRWQRAKRLGEVGNDYKHKQLWCLRRRPFGKRRLRFGYLDYGLPIQRRVWAELWRCERLRLPYRTQYVYWEQPKPSIAS